LDDRSQIIYVGGNAPWDIPWHIIISWRVQEDENILIMTYFTTTNFSSPFVESSTALYCYECKKKEPTNVEDPPKLLHDVEPTHKPASLPIFDQGGSVIWPVSWFFHIIAQRQRAMMAGAAELIRKS
jgi:hypothetical protein